jgi:hypothetical protein
MNQLLKLLTDDLKAMSLKEHFWYWILPVFLLSTLMIFYFSGVPFLVELIAPKANWEWGLLENIQLSVILVISGLSLFAFFKKTALLQRLLFGSLFFFSIFIALEEIDYGAHFIQYFRGEQTSFLLERTGMLNIHNQGNNNTLFRRTAYGLMMIVFAISPFLNKKFFHPLIEYLIPKPRMLLVVMLFLLFYWVPRYLVRSETFEPGVLGFANIGEFTELMVYFSFLLYVVQIVFKKEWPGKMLNQP